VFIDKAQSIYGYDHLGKDVVWQPRVSWMSRVLLKPLRSIP